MRLDEYFNGNEESRRLFDCLREMVESMGPVEADASVLLEQLAQLDLASRWTRERAQRWWGTHRPRPMEPCAACDGAHVVPALSSSE